LLFKALYLVLQLREVSALSFEQHVQYSAPNVPNLMEKQTKKMNMQKNNNISHIAREA